MKQPTSRIAFLPARLGGAVNAVGLALAALAAGVPSAARGQAAQPMPVRYTWVAAENRQFTEPEIQRLASSYAWIIIEKNHAGYDVNKQNDDARRLKAANPEVRVFMNYLAALVNNGYRGVFGPLGFKDEWYLQDDRTARGHTAGEKIPFLIRGEVRGYFVDLANPEYRAWIEGIIVPRLKDSAFDGLMWDNFRTPLGLAAAGLTPQRLKAQEQGLRLLLRESRAKMPAGKLLLFNGITRGSGGGERADRELDCLETADAAHDEYFCYVGGGRDRFRSAKDVQEDIDLLARVGAQKKTLLYAIKLAQAKAAGDPARLAQIKRYCYGCFLMGYVPGHGFIQFRTAATIEAGQLDGNDSAEVHLDLGVPVGPYALKGSLLSREFTKGWVFVNQGSAPEKVGLPRDLALASGPEAGRQFHRGQDYALPAEDAGFFLYPREGGGP